MPVWTGPLFDQIMFLLLHDQKTNVLIIPKQGPMICQKNNVQIPIVLRDLQDIIILFDKSWDKKCLIWAFGLDLVRVWATQIFGFWAFGQKIDLRQSTNINKRIITGLRCYSIFVWATCTYVNMIFCVIACSAGVEK